MFTNFSKITKVLAGSFGVCATATVVSGIRDIHASKKAGEIEDAVEVEAEADETEVTE